MKEMIKHELKKTMHTALKKMEEINAMDIDEIDSEELHDLKNCVKIICHAVDLENKLSEEMHHADKAKAFSASV